jgi:hypothetical protein
MIKTPLDSGIDVGPIFIILDFFSRPYCLFKEGESTFFVQHKGLIQGPMFILFCKIFHFIRCPITDSRVVKLSLESSNV